MSQPEVHDPTVLAHARALIEHTNPAGAAQEVLNAVSRNEEWRGKRCLNLLAPEAPTSPTVRRLLSAEIGTRAAEGHIGRVNRWFAGTQYIDEVGQKYPSAPSASNCSNRKYPSAKPSGATTPITGSWAVCSAT
jgi:glycine/serine hydroxymethyltransferase